MEDLLNRSKFLVEILEKHKINKNLSFLEIGSGTNRNVDYLKYKGWKNVTGIDKDKGSAIEDIDIKSYDIIFTMSTLFLIPIEKEWVFEKIAKMSRKFIITIEGETSKPGIGVIGRNYGDIFTKLGFEQVDYITNVFNEYGVLRVFKKI